MSRAVVALAFATLVMVAPSAQAACADDEKALRSRIAREPDKARAMAAEKALAPLRGPSRPGESDCLNVVSRARRALRETPATTAKPANSVLPLYTAGPQQR